MTHKHLLWFSKTSVKSFQYTDNQIRFTSRPAPSETSFVFKCRYLVFLTLSAVLSHMLDNWRPFDIAVLGTRPLSGPCCSKAQTGCCYFWPFLKSAFDDCVGGKLCCGLMRSLYPPFLPGMQGQWSFDVQGCESQVSMKLQYLHLWKDQTLYLIRTHYSDSSGQDANSMKVRCDLFSFFHLGIFSITGYGCDWTTTLGFQFLCI